MCIGQDAGDLAEHAGLVFHAQAQVVAGKHLIHGQHAHVLPRIGVKGQVRHAVLRVAGGQAGHVHQVGNHGAGGWLAACALAVVQGGANGIAMHHNGIHGAFYIGNQPLAGHQCGVHAQLYALRVAGFFAPFGNAQQLDAVAQMLGVFDVGGRELGDALHIGLVKLHRNAESNGAHDGGLVGGVHAFDVKRRVGLGIAQALGLFEHHVKVQPFVAHLAQNEIGGAVDDAGQPLDAVGRQALAQCLDDGDAAGHGRLKRHHHAFLLCGLKNFGAVHGQ